MCGVAWPCAGGKAELRRDYAADTVGIVVLMSGYLVEAVHDLDLPPGEVSARFLGWCRAPGTGRTNPNVPRPGRYRAD